MQWQNPLLKVLLPLQQDSQRMTVYLVSGCLLTVASSVLFGNHVLDSATPKSISSQGPSGRHTPVQQPTPFRVSAPHTQQPQQAQHQITSHRTADITPSYDIDSWFSTFPSTNSSGPTGPTSEFTQFQVTLLIFTSLISE
jgi:hypothetical protein